MTDNKGCLIVLTVLAVAVFVAVCTVLQVAEWVG